MTAESEEELPTFHPPRSSVHALWRGLTKRCPRCGRGHLFHRWFKMTPSCPDCRLIFEREEGSFLGSMALNYGAAGIAFIAVLVVWLVIDLPDVHTGWLMATAIATVIIVPLVFFPFAKTIWAALDYLMTGGELDLTPPNEPDVA
jgi:uncharacterized protein (DUF983 family)